MKLQMGKTGESSLCRMCRVENKTVSHIVSECKMLVQKNIKSGMTIYAGVFVGDYAKNMAFKEHNSGASMSWIELSRTKGTRFCGIL